jgi:hypothetical protein
MPFLSKVQLEPALRKESLLDLLSRIKEQLSKSYLSPEERGSLQNERSLIENELKSLKKENL